MKISILVALFFLGLPIALHTAFKHVDPIKESDKTRITRLTAQAEKELQLEQDARDLKLIKERLRQEKKLQEWKSAILP